MSVGVPGKAIDSAHAKDEAVDHVVRVRADEVVIAHGHQMGKPECRDENQASRRGCKPATDLAQHPVEQPEKTNQDDPIANHQRMQARPEQAQPQGIQVGRQGSGEKGNIAVEHLAFRQL